ncbi:MAG: hypothetical protein ACP5US_10755 [Candidatus Kryptoniota bacterium]
MFGYYEDFGYGRGGFGLGRGRGYGSGFCYGRGLGLGRGRGFGWFGLPFFGGSEVESLKLYRDRLELHKKDIEAEIKYVNERIESLEK